MANDHQKISVQLTPSQFAALKSLSEIENCSFERLIERSVDTFIATYKATEATSIIERKLDRMHDHIVKLLVSLMKLVGQTLYFSSLPLTAGPVKAKLNEEGVSLHWHQSEQFAVDLLKPPATKSKDVSAN